MRHKVYLTVEEREVASAWGDWIEGLASWKIFATLTMRDRTREDGELYSPGVMSCRRMSGEFAEYLRLFSSEIEWVTAYELQPGRSVYHVHSLYSGPFERDLDQVAIPACRRWAWANWGYNRIERFLPSVGASGYLGKYLVKEGGDVDFSPGLGKKEWEK